MLDLQEGGIQGTQFEECWINKTDEYRVPKFEECWINKTDEYRVPKFEECWINKTDEYRVPKFEESRYTRFWNRQSQV
jgi:hypothetical protein